MAAASYLVQTRNGVYCARFVVPLTHRGSSTSAGREIRVSTLTKDPRDAVARARLLRVLYESLLQQGGVFCRESISTYFQSIMAQFKAPPPGTPKFGMEYDFATGKVKFEDVRPGEEATVMSMMEDCHGQAFSDTQLRYFRQLPVHSPQGFGSPVRSAICVCCRS